MVLSCSDDDLEPYDMLRDRKTAQVKAPVYVRECMEGLLNREQPDLVEMCIARACSLIRKHPDTVKEVRMVRGGVPWC